MKPPAPCRTPQGWKMTPRTWAQMPTNFSNLSSEYIGILYGGLHDFELYIWGRWTIGLSR
jgi:hypothetical protein